jgi:hypothetical protein
MTIILDTVHCFEYFQKKKFQKLDVFPSLCETLVR